MRHLLLFSLISLSVEVAWLTNRTEQMWWQKYIEPFRDRSGGWLTTRFLSGRMRFLKPGQSDVGPNERPPFGIVLCIWTAGEIA